MNDDSLKMIITKDIHKQPPELFCYKGVHKNFPNFIGKQLSWGLFNKDTGLRSATLLKRAPTQLFPCEICEIFKSTYFEEHLRTTASGYIKNWFLFSLLHVDTELIFKCFGFNNQLIINDKNLNNYSKFFVTLK